MKLIPLIKKIDDAIAWKYKLLRSWWFVKTGGYSCQRCGKNHIYYKSCDGEGTVTRPDGSKVKMLLSWHGEGYKNPVCLDCLLDAVNAQFRSGKDVVIGECDFTGAKNIPVIKIIWAKDNPKKIGLRLGLHYWNGFYASQEALNEAIETVVQKSGIREYRNGKHYYQEGQNYVFKVPDKYTQTL